MILGSFSSMTPIALLTAASLVISGCETLPTQQIISLGAGVLGAVVCYKNVGGGSMRLISGAACGVGGYMVAEWFQKNNDKGEVTRVGNEYQRALSNAQANGMTPYTVTTKSSGTPTNITLTVYHIENYGGTECRSFNERITVGTTVRSDQVRRACRDLINNKYGAWNILAA